MGEASKKILVVDDKAENRKILKDLLTFKGYQIVEADSGKEAIKRAKESPDLILLDILMPGMDGYEVAKQLKADNKTKEIPFIVLTANEDNKETDKAFAAGAKDYVVKPFQPADLLGKISKVLN